MSKRARNRRAGRLAAALLVAGFGLAACEEEVQSPPLTGISTEVASLRVTLGTGQTLTLFKDGKITLSPLTFTRPTTTISVTLLDAGGSVMNGGVSRIRPGQPADLIAQNIPNAASMCYDAGANQLVIPMNANNALAFIKLN